MAFELNSDYKLDSDVEIKNILGQKDGRVSSVCKIEVTRVEK